MKISASSIKQKVQERELLKKAAQEEIKADKLKRARILDDIFTRCLEAATEGETELDLGYEFDDLNDSYNNLFEEKGFDVFSIHSSDYELRILDSKLNHLDYIKRDEIAIAKSQKTIASLLKYLQPHAVCEIDFHEIEEFLNSTFDENSKLKGDILAIFQASLLFSSELFDFSKISSDEEKKTCERYLDTINLVFENLNNIFSYLDIHKFDIDKFAQIISWLTLNEDDVFNYEPTSDYFDTLSFGWLASFHGQLFLSAFANSVEEKVSRNATSLNLHLYKFSSGYRIEFENKAETYTLLDELAFEGLFKKLGYNVSIQSTQNDEVDILVSWN
ncbi:hypothetical protein ICN28_05875 [Polynucleobacter sp. 30F-ANTBAC]|uniref:hypothetical protein n=1 Tax=Polynucleobacter sp. 30F-ANTBAC TaxID=2689095 RepID=UPI001C0E639E|nr:hypothetical protein [Polynucleobacter sp. 30F-ANTBAC]MBU3600040.1 hypothetical protein [Polynucleobacter sp. 30F-ANTBAC]